MDRKYKVIILVLSVGDNGGIYDKFQKSQIDTWDSIEVDNVHTFYFYGDGDSDRVSNNLIFTDIKENLFTGGFYVNSPLSACSKTIRALEIIDNIEYDYIFRTNSSSYVDKNMLYDFLFDKPRTNYYSGFIGYENLDIYGSKVDMIKYASGSGFFLSKDLVSLLLSKKESIEDNRFIDDAAIGRILNQNNIYPSMVSRVENDVNTEHFHYRLRTNDRYFDINNMYKIFEIKNKK